MRSGSDAGSCEASGVSAGRVVFENLPPLRRGQGRGFWRLTEASVLPQGREERRQAPLDFQQEKMNDSLRRDQSDHRIV